MYTADIYLWNLKPNKFYFIIFSGKTLHLFSRLKFKRLIIFSLYHLLITTVILWVFSKEWNLLDGLMTTEDNWISNNISYLDTLKVEKITLTFKNLLNWLSILLRISTWTQIVNSVLRRLKMPLTPKLISCNVQVRQLIIWIYVTLLPRS